MRKALRNIAYIDNTNLHKGNEIPPQRTEPLQEYAGRAYGHLCGSWLLERTGDDLPKPKLTICMKRRVWYLRSGVQKKASRNGLFRVLLAGWSAAVDRPTGCLDVAIKVTCDGDSSTSGDDAGDVPINLHSPTSGGDVVSVAGHRDRAPVAV